MDYSRALKELASFSYKPNFRFRAERTARGVRFKIYSDVPDVREPQRMIQIMSGREWTTGELSCMRREDLHYQAVELIRRHEEHEMQEWLMYDGELLTDPHPDVDHGRPVRGKIVLERSKTE